MTVIKTMPKQQQKELERCGWEVLSGSMELETTAWGSTYPDNSKGDYSLKLVPGIIDDFTFACLKTADERDFKPPTPKDMMARIREAEKHAKNLASRAGSKDPEPLLRPMLGFVGIRATLVHPDQRKPSLDDVTNTYFEKFLKPAFKL